MMFKTIFGKLILLFIVILLVGYSVTGALMYYFLDKSMVKEETNTLEAVSDNIGEFVIWYLENRDNSFAMLALEQFLANSSSYTDSMIWIVTIDGYMWKSTPDFPDELKEKFMERSNGFMKLPEEWYQKVMSGNVSGSVIGDFYGFFRDKYFEQYGSAWLTLAKPLKYKQENGEEQTIAAVYLHTPVPKVQETKQTVFKYFVISVGAAVLISIFLAYILSKRFTKPLKQISNAAKVIAEGEFTKRLDISSQDEIGDLAANFNQMVADLQNLEEMRRGFIANVSHELRTPMTSIRGFIEGILDGVIPPEKQNGYLVIIRDEINRLSRLVSDLLDLSKMEAGEMNMTMKDIDINELIRRCIIKLENQIVNKNLQIEADFEEEEMRVHADPDAIDRVLFNLVHNAVKFTPENGKISIGTSTYKDKVLINVTDSGIGISKNEIGYIWDRFYKSDKSRGRDKTGTGLGLAIVKGIIAEHRQEIWVESEPGKGTVFSFTLERA